MAEGKKFYQTLGGKLLLWFLGLSLVPMLVLSIVSYRTASTSLREQIFSKLSAVSDIKKRQIEYYFFEIFGTMGFRFFMLLGLFGLFYLICKCKDKKSIPIIILLFFLITIFGRWVYFSFHITAALILAMIVWQYYQNWRRTKKACYPFWAFAILLLSQIIFCLLFLTPKVYVIAETVQLGGFLLLLYCYIKLVLKNG